MSAKAFDAPRLMLSDMRGVGPGDSVSWLVPSSCAAYRVSLGGNLPSKQAVSHSGFQCWALVQKATAGPSAQGAAASQMLLSGWAWGLV